MPEKYIRKIFVVSLVIKAFDGVLQVIGGLLLLMPKAIAGLLSWLIAEELIEDPTDFIANQIGHTIPYLSSNAVLFGALYLLSHGAIKIVLVAGLLKRKLWMYPTSMIVFGLFIVYQLYRYSHTHSIFLIILTIFDLFLMALTWHEYRFMRKNRALTSEQKSIG